MNEDLYKRVLLTLGLLVVFRFGSYIPIAGVDSYALMSVAHQHQEGVLGMFNMLSGGALGRMSIFALAIMPYITASIIIQLMSIVYKPLEDLRKEGELGKRKITQISRYLTIILAAFQAYGIANGLEHMSNPRVVVLPGLIFKITSVVTLVVGTMFLMWLGEQISARGIGNGSSLIIFVGIISSFPGAIVNVFDLLRKGVLSYGAGILVFLCLGFIVYVIVFCERSHRRISIQYPKRNMPNKATGGELTYIPLKINTAGVIAPMFASSVLLFPLTIINFAGESSGAMEWLSYNLSHGRPLFILLYGALIMFFSFFYAAIVFNAEETANNLRKYGAFVAGRRPGTDTILYLDDVLTRITAIGALYLCLVCIIPEVIMNKLSVSFNLGGTSLLIVVNVVLETFAQVQSHMFSSKYESVMKRMQIK